MGWRALGLTIADRLTSILLSCFSILIGTVHRGQEAVKDARFLFGPPQPQDVISEGLTPPAIPSPAASITGTNKQLNSQKIAGTYYVTLDSSIPSKDRIQALVNSIHPMMDEDSDILLIGRGKLGQRPKEFRHSLDSMYGEMSDLGLMEEIGNDIKAVGKTLGAATESILISGIRASMLVVQASRK